MTSDRILLDNVSKFYGDVLGVNRVSLNIRPGITSFVGPNGSGKTTLMNLITGLIRPTQGSISVLGLTPDDPERFYRQIGYCTQYDSFPRGITGHQFVCETLLLRGVGMTAALELTAEALSRVGLEDAGDRKVGGYSKGMRQRIRLAQAIAHHPTVLVLDEPLNGLDPMARAEAMALFQALRERGMHLLISSHILNEVDRFSDSVVLINSGYVVAEGQIHEVRGEVTDQPLQILVRCDKPSYLASKVFAQDHVVEARVHGDGGGLLVRTRDAEQFHMLLSRIIANGEIEVEAVASADDDVNAIYQYLIGSGNEGGTQ